jgi:hypothetical protein
MTTRLMNVRSVWQRPRRQRLATRRTVRRAVMAMHVPRQTRQTGVCAANIDVCTMP